MGDTTRQFIDVPGCRIDTRLDFVDVEDVSMA
jgi:hypothetical protein